MHDGVDRPDPVRRVDVLLDLAGRAPEGLVDARLDRGEQRDARQALGRHRQPGLRLPRHHVASLAHRGAEVEELGRPLRIPDVLVLARPLDAHRPAHRPRQEGGVERRVLRAGLAVGSGAVQVDQPHLVPRQPEQPGERLAKAVRRLGRRPDRGAVGTDVRHAARRAEGAVRLDRPPVRRPERLHARARGAERSEVALLRHVLVPHDAGRADGVGERGMVGQPGPGGPLGSKRAGGPHGVPLALGDDPEEAAHADGTCPGNRRDGRLVDRLELGADRGSPDHPPVEHPGERQVLHVEVAPRDLRGNVRPRHGLADVPEGARGLERRLGVDLESELPVPDEIAVGDAGAAALRTDDAVDNLEIPHGPAEPLGPEGEQRLPRGRPGTPELLTSAGDARAATGPALVRADGCVPLDQLGDALDGDVELFGHHLAHRGPATCPEVHLAREDGDRVVGVDRQESVDLVGRHGLAEVPVRGPAGRRRARRRLRSRRSRRPATEPQSDDQRAARAEERATGDRSHPRLLPSRARRASWPGSPGRGSRIGRGSPPAPA